MKEPSYFFDSEAEAIGRKLVEECGEFWHLRGDDLIGEQLGPARIAYLRCTDPMSDGSRTLLGEARRVGKMFKMLTGYDFIIRLNADEWGEMTERERERLVHHELMHCFYREKTDRDGNVWYSWDLRQHDLEEFVATVARYGDFRGSIEPFMEAMEPHGEDGRKAIEG